MNATELQEQRRLADQYAVIRLPEASKPPRRYRIKNYAENFLTGAWLASVVRSLFR